MEEQCLIMWIKVTLNEGSFTLYSHTIKCVAIVSRDFMSILKNYIEKNYWFDILYGRRPKFYNPKNVSNVTSVSQISASTERVKFHAYFNECVDLSMFTNITQIVYGFSFNEPIENRLPPNLTSLGREHCYTHDDLYPVSGFAFVSRKPMRILDLFPLQKETLFFFHFWP
eukprot:TRINITY_DN4382_c0_g1_i4.p1 TRINITY_DN4382_c0_g1~~TRINITY_DN4382_c0_g1_i4.p1  ORF type:complete len:170 (-),score=16.07 TRINITY_DN4382_c0_g1_i4:728-1237(-)